MTKGQKRRIDEIRDGAFHMDVGDGDDTTPISDMLTISGRMHIIKGDGIYRIDLPDAIDPARTNAGLPATQQRIIARGANDELVGRTLLLTKELCRDGVLAEHVNIDDVLARALEFLKEMTTATAMTEDYEKEELRLISEFDGYRKQDGSLRLPAIRDADDRCKKFVQSCAHATKHLEVIAKTFYPALKSKWRDELEKTISDDAEAEASFKDFIKAANRFLTFLQNTRNAIEHPSTGHVVRVLDFRMTPSGKVAPPSFMLEHPTTSQDEVPMLNLMRSVTSELLMTFELMVAHLCNRFCQPFGDMELRVVHVDEANRRNKHIAYGYVTRLGDQVVPFG